MSTELQNVTSQLFQTRFHGGPRGVCVQVTQMGLSPNDTGNRVGFGVLQLTRADAALLATELQLFADGNEVEADELQRR
jgi:hypothetical protein